MAKLSLNLIVFSLNEIKYFPLLFESLKKQTFQDWELNVLDNNAGAEVMSAIGKELANLGRNHRVIHSNENLGFANGHNLLYKETMTQYVLMLNPDMYLMPDSLEKLILFMDQHQEVSTVSSRLMRWDFSQAEKGELEKSFTNQIDAIGIRLMRNRRAVEWLAQQEWKSDSESPEVRSLVSKSIVEVFGVSGALPLYRRDSLKNALLPNDDIFDPTYHSYKEDLDLAYRLRNLGYTSYIILNSVVYHDRTGAAPKKMGNWDAILNYRCHSKYIRFHSYKNHLRTLYKNEYWQNFLLDFFPIVWFEFKKFVFLLFTDPAIVFKGWKEIIKDFKYTNKARHLIKEKRKMYWKGLRRWF